MNVVIFMIRGIAIVYAVSAFGLFFLNHELRSCACSLLALVALKGADFIESVEKTAIK